MKHSAGKTLNIKYRHFFFLGLLAFLFTAQPVLAAEESNDEWIYHGSIYLWASDIHLQDPEGDDTEISFNDIVDTLDIAAMGGFGAQKNKLGFQIDAIYMDTTDSDDNTLRPRVTLTDVELTAVILTPMATYRVVDDGQFNLDLLGGVRYLYMDVNLKFDTLSDIGDDGSTTDGIIGFRGDVQLNKNWHMPFYYDVGKGDSELTYQAFVGISYKYPSFDLAAGYRYLKFKFDNDEDFGGVLNHLIIQGPQIGAKFWF
jgi:hypothetical protein